MTHKQIQHLYRIAFDTLEHPKLGGGYRDTRDERRLVALGLIEVNDKTLGGSGPTVLDRIPMKIRCATPTDAGWAALANDPVPPQVEFLDRRVGACVATWPRFRSCLARGWVEDAGSPGTDQTWRKWKRTPAGRDARKRALAEMVGA